MSKRKEYVDLKEYDDLKEDLTIVSADLDAITDEYNAVVDDHAFLCSTIYEVCLKHNIDGNGIIEGLTKDNLGQCMLEYINAGYDSSLMNETMLDVLKEIERHIRLQRYDYLALKGKSIITFKAMVKHCNHIADSYIAEAKDNIRLNRKITYLKYKNTVSLHKIDRLKKVIIIVGCIATLSIIFNIF